MGEEPLTLYYDLMSQPSRAVLIFARLAGISLKMQLVNIAQGETRTPDFGRVNPLRKVPCLRVGKGESAFTVVESATILRFLAETRGAADHWYPGEPAARARVSAALDWHHGSVRLGVMLQAFHRVLAARLGGTPQPALDAHGQAVLKGALRDLERVWLGGGRGPWLGGGEAMSVADLQVAAELEQLALLAAAPQGPYMEEQLAPFPGVRAWLERVREAGGAAYAEAHALLPRAIKAFSKQAAKL